MPGSSHSKLLQLVMFLIAAQVVLVYFFGEQVIDVKDTTTTITRTTTTKSPVSSINTHKDDVSSRNKKAPVEPTPANAAELEHWWEDPAHSHQQRQQNRALSTFTTTEPRVFFAHVGKAGGESIRATLRLGCQFMRNRKARTTCWQDLYQAFYGAADLQQPGEPALSRYTTGVLHYLDLHPAQSNRQATHFLYSIRHPIERMASWYRYVAPTNCAAVPNKREAASCRVEAAIRKDANCFEAQFFGCFPTMSTIPNLLRRYYQQQQQRSSIATSLLNESEQACAILLLNTLQGKVTSHMAGHMIANYQFYHHYTLGNTTRHLPLHHARLTEANRGTRHDAAVLVVRTPTLWQDMRTADLALGGTGYFYKAGLRVSHQSEAYVERAVLDAPADRQAVCCAMQTELELYQELLRRAINLEPADKAASMQSTWEVCNVSSSQELHDVC